ncbi:16S rRNA (cytosine(1402)-N(4))-methyltransferase [Candidatus Daviesbacteria bacterium RIFCSPHIGHO2_01_FULL_44_29]|uniref:Ribosomal RNA small subunit methyltransferase H n=1 Tax=Candidatus Daviesbacteria bacterium RIFCSPHIGHO2_02_FULL_43_12 TaxID=1797776 RepID=A0A1F5KKE1_9BACT|nr:MAG: 16S rRNA (cytosine(1402)-N(4))-methyltransferase [Candidatus Daviesbacteria bacterium RIFCSPHIGHO2_01_FULL_44_29]OGE40864.1 MAG: 16S rRNA (cytosine(1402)-N(4))-methyltransferase [Candidatus Daviesbacteria bacterium RIFCSPHIGHO2_12_FULL_47_45]OGE41280.1 MAG: 16S rRNA (cytosine(1402)-N(4))-methyltransferase [Candidatus Daviesbacteria bacterium RIFCSPHIGHO2_02_FULL_43_12]OGE69481.1 MAG: 16S rRNA (cytosine(1402)-N(4))-methyltransferase [Candidatus Daviesbacteria bacterium RIFCSPLOWO2_01_FULL
MDKVHTSVLLSEAIDALQIEKNKYYVDCTLGDGGYTVEIVRRGGQIFGLDQDTESIKRAKERLGALGLSSKVVIKQGNFAELDNLIDQPVAGFVYDLGVSSNQLEDGERGFSFSRDAPLDMRMDMNLSVRAADLINGLNKGELEKLFATYGEFVNKKALKAIIESRKLKAIETTTELAGIVERAVGRGKDKIHPATLIFQALRIAVNDELNSLRTSLPKAVELLEDGGRIVVVSFHSLEDRIAKESFKEFEKEGKGVVITEKPITPEVAEIMKNPRSRSAKMRIFEKNEKFKKSDR